MQQLRTARPLTGFAGAPRDGVRALGTGAQPTAMQHLTALASALSTETSLAAAAARVQRDASQIFHVRDALLFWIDWPHRMAWTLGGRVNHDVEELVIDVAGSGKRGFLSGAIIEPLGPAPTRAVLALRKPSGLAFVASELTVIGTLASCIAPAMDRLIRAR